MTEQELSVLERIWKGKTSWGSESEDALNSLAAIGYIEIIEKREAPGGVSEVLVKITDEGGAHLSGSGY